jgi:hypothetical protein
MLRKIIGGLVLAGVAAMLGGCVAVAAAGGAVAWQGGKVISEERTPRDQVVRAVTAAFKAERIVLKEEVEKTRATQLRGEYPDGANVSVDVLPTGDRSCRIEIRVGIGLREPARDLLDKIRSRI